MCDVMLTDGITHPPEPAAPVSFKGSKVTVWVMDAVLGLQTKREHVAEWCCRTQHATAASHLHFRLLISKSRLVEPPQIVSPHPCSLNPLKFMMPTQGAPQACSWVILSRSACSAAGCGWLFLHHPAWPWTVLQRGPERPTHTRTQCQSRTQNSELCVKSYMSNYHKYVFIYYLCHIPNWQKCPFYVLNLTNIM